MKVASQKTTVVCVVAASLMVALALVALSSNSASSQVLHLHGCANARANKNVFLYTLSSPHRALFFRIIAAADVSAGSGAVRPLVIHGGIAPLITAVCEMHPHLSHRTKLHN
jgi:hypothetical protein